MTATISKSTCVEVARLAGVSQATVSRVFTGRGPVAADTRRRIMKAATAIGYRPNPLARGLRGGATQAFGIAWSLAGPHASEGMVRRIALRAHDSGYVTTVADHLNNPGMVCKVIEGFSDRGVDAVVLLDTAGLLWPALVKSGFAQRISRWVVITTEVVQTPPMGDPLVMVDHIRQDRCAAIREIARYFVQTGRRRPAIITPFSANGYKIDAFRDELATAGLPGASVTAIDAVSSSAEAFYEALERQFPGAPDFDALLCTTDEGALACLAWMRHRGIRVPDQVGLVGFNNSSLGPWIDPPLATVDRRDNQLADMIGQLLFERLEDPSLPPRELTLPMQFVHRDSAGHPLPA